MVLSISGTTGFEAALYEKPSIIFADVNYENLESVYRLRQIEDLPNVIRKALKQKVNLLLRVGLMWLDTYLDSHGSVLVRKQPAPGPYHLINRRHSV